LQIDAYKSTSATETESNVNWKFDNVLILGAGIKKNYVCTYTCIQLL